MNNGTTTSFNMAPMALPRNLKNKTVQLIFALSALLAVGLASTAHASDDKITRTHQVTVQEQSQLIISNGVGKVDVRAHDAPDILVEVTIEAGRRGLLRRKVDISDMDITVEQNQQRIRLALQEDNVSASWVVHVPSFEQVQLKVGVGQIQTKWLTSALDLDVGVGDVQVYVDIDYLGEFSANVGVGSIKAEGVHNYSSTRRVVAESSSGRGRGEHKLDIEVGVGDIQVKAESPR